jgi:hypothetical protein
VAIVIVAMSLEGPNEAYRNARLDKCRPITANAQIANKQFIPYFFEPLWERNLGADPFRQDAMHLAPCFEFLPSQPFTLLSVMYDLTISRVCSFDSSTQIEMCRVSSSITRRFLVVVEIAATGPRATYLFRTRFPFSNAGTIRISLPSLIRVRMFESGQSYPRLHFALADTRRGAGSPTVNSAKPWQTH